MALTGSPYCPLVHALQNIRRVCNFAGERSIECGTSNNIPGTSDGGKSIALLSDEISSHLKIDQNWRLTSVLSAVRENGRKFFRMNTYKIGFCKLFYF